MEIESFINLVLYEFSYVQLYFISFAYFLILYFGLGSMILLICRSLEKIGLLKKIIEKNIDLSQIRFEIKHSFLSIVIFGFSIIPVIFLIRNGQIKLLNDSFLNIIMGLAVLFIWNEIHFYFIHKLMHQKYMMKNFHVIHHRSRIPNVYSVYSFHWIEAFLLSTVPLTIVTFIPFSIVAVFIFPIVSLLFNLAGHSNYRFGNGKGANWKLFATHHNQHHSEGSKNYNFALYLIHRIFSKPNKS